MLIGRRASTALPAMDEASTLSRNSWKSTAIESFCESMECRIRLLSLARSSRVARRRAPERVAGNGVLPSPLSSAGSSTYTLPASAPVIWRLLSRMRSSSLLMSRSEDKAREISSSSLRS